MKKETKKLDLFMSQLRDLLVGQKLSKVSRTVDMPILWLGDVEKVRDNLIPDSGRTIADCEIHVQCPFTLKHAGSPVIGSYDVYLDESGKHVDPDHPDVKTIYDTRAEEIPALELMVQDISFHPVLGMTMHFQDQYSLTINHDSRLLTDFWCLRAKDQEFVFVNDELEFDCAATKPIENLESTGNDHPSAGELQKLVGKELKRIKLIENGNLILFFGEDIPWQDDKGQARKTTRYTLRIYMPFRMLDQSGILWGSGDYLYNNSEYTPDEHCRGVELDQMTRAFVGEAGICAKDITVNKPNEIKICFSNGTVFQTLPHSSSSDLMCWELRDNRSSKAYD